MKEGNQEGLPEGGETCTVSRQEKEQEGGLGGLEEEYLGRGKSREKAPTPERSRHHQKTAVPSALSRVLGERREVRVWAKSRAQELPVCECFLGNSSGDICEAFAGSIGGMFGVYADMDSEGQWWEKHSQLRFETQNHGYYLCDLGQLTSPPSPGLPYI